jgi:replicative DNA helicase
MESTWIPLPPDTTLRIDDVAEHNVLGMMLEKPELYNKAIEVLGNNPAIVFGTDKHRVVYQAVIDVMKDGTPLTVDTISRCLDSKGLLGRAGGKDGLELLCACSAPGDDNANFDYYAGIVKDYATERRYLNASKTIPTIVRNDDITLNEKIAKIQKGVLDISSSHAPAVSFDEQVMGAKAWIVERREAKDTYEIPFGFPTLDLVTLGLHPGELTILAGRPSCGKSSFAHNIILNANEKHTIPAIYFDYEGTATALLVRMAATLSGQNLFDIRAGKSPDYDVLLGTTMDIISKLPIEIPATRPDVFGIASKVSAAKQENSELKLVIVDHVQIVPPSGKEVNEYARVSEISRELKAIAVGNDVAVLALSQLSRASMHVERPNLSHLRASGTLEQDADNVIIMYQDNEVDDTSRGMYLAKQRNGPVCEIPMVFEKECLKFYER